MRSVRYQLSSAKLPVHRDLAGFDFAQSKVNKSLIDELATTAFAEQEHNVVFIGGTGTGKTHLATALGVAGITRHNKRIRFYSTVDLVNLLEQEKAAGKAGQLAFSLLRMDLVILDELGYLPFSPSGGALLFHLLSKLYEHRREGISAPGSALPGFPLANRCSLRTRHGKNGGANDYPCAKLADRRKHDERLKSLGKI